MDETYCFLCGVCFGIDIDLYHGRLTEQDVQWSEYFLALRRNPVSYYTAVHSYYLSGVGCGIAYDGRVPAKTYDVRQHKGEEETYDGDHVVAYTDRGKTGLEVVYPMHPECWDLFLQNHALLLPSQTPDLNKLGQLLARQDLEESDGRGMRPDWLPFFEYGDVNKFWGDGWRYSEEIGASDVNQITQNGPEFDFLVCDPKMLPDFDDLPEGASSFFKNKNTSQFNKAASARLDQFSSLPMGIRLSILCFLPSPSVKNLRVASRSMATTPLDSRYWRTRFQWPNELCHVKLPTSLGSRHIASDDFDWMGLCYHLLYPPSPSQNLRNRDRILALTRKLVDELAFTNRDPQGEPEVDARENGVLPLQYVSCNTIDAPKTISIHFSNAKAIQQIQTIFKQHGRDQVLVGITVVDSEGLQSLGARNGEYKYSSGSYDGFVLNRVSLGLKEGGIVGIAFEATDGLPKEAIMGLNFGTFGVEVALGRINAGEGEQNIIRGLVAGLARDGRIVRLGALPLESVQDVPAWHERPAQTLWYPSFPPLNMSQMPAVGLRSNNVFAYMHHFVFASDEDDLEHLTGISANLDGWSPGISQLHFYYDDRNPAPMSFNAHGKDVNFLIDGVGGERIVGLDVLCSANAKSVGIEIYTNRNRTGCFAPADIPGPLSAQRLQPRQDTLIIGLFGRVNVQNGVESSLQSFGLLCTSRIRPTTIATLSPSNFIRRFDDHLNVWSEKLFPPSTYLFGEAFGGQPNGGFINWLDFNKPIQRITAGLSVTKRDVAGRPLVRALTGLKLYIQGEGWQMLGRCEFFGSYILFDATDKIVGVTLGAVSQPGVFALKEVIFATQNGVMKGFKDGDVASTIEESSVTRLLHSTSQMRLVGLAWSFALGSPNNRDFGLQPLYEKRQLNPDRLLNLYDTLYPSIRWQYPALKPPPIVHLRPIPDVTVDQYNFSSINVFEEDRFGKLQSLGLTTIRIYFNAFIQGLILQFSNGVTRSLGNLVGQEEVFHVGEDEQVFTVWFYERQQPLNEGLRWINGIRFGVMKTVQGEPRERCSPFYGCVKPFGPFVNQQAGMSEPATGSSVSVHCSEVRIRKLYLEPGTSFAGMYFESLQKTFVRRAGILVSHFDGLPEEIRALHPPDVTSAEDSTLSPDTQIEEVIPWLGPSPPSSYIHSPAIGQEKGIYRMWCQAPDNIASITIYQQTTPDDKIVTVGLELHSRFPTRGESKSTLLGHRTLATRHTHEIFLDGEERIIGVSIVKGDKNVQIQMTSKPAILSEISILTTAQQERQEEVDDNDDFTIERHVKEGPKNTEITTSTLRARTAGKGVVGFYAFVDEFIEGIGFFTKEVPVKSLR